MSKHYLCTGSEDHWDAAKHNKMWGIIPGSTRSIVQQSFEKCAPGDIVFFYSKGNVGIRGWGIIRDKWSDDKRLTWPEEIKKGIPIYTQRFSFYLAAHDFGKNPVGIKEIRASVQGGINPLKKEVAHEILSRCREWGIFSGSIMVARLSKVVHAARRKTLVKVAIIMLTVIIAIGGFF